MRSLDETVTELRLWEATLRRSLRDASAFLLQAGGFRQKLVVGMLVGALGRALATLRSRLDEIDHTTARSEPDGMTLDALRVMVEQRAREASVADLPTAWMCEALVLDLDRVLRCVHGESFRDLATALRHEVATPIRDREIAFGDVTYVDDPLPVLLATEDGRRRLLHYICLDIEIAAAEVCAKSIIDAAKMPGAFVADMARQCWDETRHAELLADRIATMGLEPGSFPSDGLLWTRYHQGEDLRQRLAIQHVVQEGNGLDSGVALIERLRAAGDERTAAIFEYLVADEVNHVRFGIRWVRWLGSDTDEAFLEAVRDAARRIGATVPRATESARRLRIAAGFTPRALDTLLNSVAVESAPHQKTGDRA